MAYSLYQYGSPHMEFIKVLRFSSVPGEYRDIVWEAFEFSVPSTKCPVNGKVNMTPGLNI
jgi:hypothetical protein